MFWKRRIYADAAAATPLSPKVQQALFSSFALFGNPGALHQEAQAAKTVLEDARVTIAATIGAEPDEIIFTGSGTEANNLALTGTLRQLARELGEVHAVTTAIEHASVLMPLRALEAEGVYTTELPVDASGRISIEELAEVIGDETALVSVQWVNSEIGTLQPLADIARVIRRVRAARVQSGNALPLLFHVDASQAPLWLRVSVAALHVDLLTLDAQKVCGPKGVGVLYIKRDTVIEPVLWGGNQERGVRAGTENAPLAAAFAVALSEAQAQAEVSATQTAAVRDYFVHRAQELFPDLVLNGALLDATLRVANNANISIPGLDAETAVIALDTEGVACSTRSACSTGDDEPSHVMVAIGVPRELARTAVRFTFLPSATKADAEYILTALRRVEACYRTSPQQEAPDA